MTVRPELADWYGRVGDALTFMSAALNSDRPSIVAAGRVALATLGRAAPGPPGEELVITQLQVAIAELVVAARDGNDDNLRFALRWVTECVEGLRAT